MLGLEVQGVRANLQPVLPGWVRCRPMCASTLAALGAGEATAAVRVLQRLVRASTCPTCEHAALALRAAQCVVLTSPCRRLCTWRHGAAAAQPQGLWQRKAKCEQKPDCVLAQVGPFAD